MLKWIQSEEKAFQQGPGWPAEVLLTSSHSNFYKLAFYDVADISDTVDVHAVPSIGPAVPEVRLLVVI